MDDRPEPTMTQVKIRCREELKRRLEAEAKAEKRSVNDVVISRLEASYDNQDIYSEIIRSRFGDDTSYKTLCAIASAWDLLSSVRAIKWYESPETIDMAMSAASYAINLVNSGGSKRLPDLEEKDREDVRRNLRSMIGYTAAEMSLAALEDQPFDENAAQRLAQDMEDLRKFDVMAWYQEEKRAGRLSDRSPDTETKNKIHRDAEWLNKQNYLIRT